MSRRVHSTPVSFGAILCVWAVITGCNSTTDTPFVTPGGTTPVTGNGGATQAGYTNPVVGQGGVKAATTAPIAPVGGATAAKGGATSVVGVGGATAKATTAVGAGGKPVTATTAVTGTGGAVVSATTAAAVSTGTGSTVTFSKGKGVGAMLGYGFVALGSKDSVSSPKCGAAEITSATPCASGTTWATDTALCVTGAIPALPAKPVSADYDTNWGLSVGLNATDPATAGLGQAFTSITFTLTGAPTTGLRAKIHKVGDPDKTDYCAALTPGVAMPLVGFTRACYDTASPGLAFAAADIPNIDKIQVQVTSGDAAIAVTDLCITGITFK